MQPIIIAAVVFALIFLGGLGGVALHSRLPDHHVGDSSKDAVRLVMGLIGTMAALVLGLLIASAKGSYDTQSGELTQISADVIQLDRALVVYGPEALPVRAGLRGTVGRSIHRVWPNDGVGSASLDLPKDKNEASDFFTLLSNLKPQTGAQQSTQARALDIANALSRTRVLMFAQAGSSIAWPFLVVLVFWLVILFTGF